MGKHFDSLVELVKVMGNNEKAQEIPCARTYLEPLVRDCTLFEFPLKAEEIFAKAGKTTPEYTKYVADYFDLSAQHDSHFLTPFPLTAVEDDVSVVMMQHSKEDEYTLTSARKVPLDNSTLLYFGKVQMRKPEERGMWVAVMPSFCTRLLVNGERLHPANNNEMMWDALSSDMQHEVRAYVEQVIYLMDPENFIIRKENKACRKYYDKPAHKRPHHILPKTVMRPHYICLSERDTRDFLQSSSKEPRAAHPVRGHLRHLVSDKWTNKKGQTIFVRQYFTGEGRIHGPNGWTYEVMVKESPKKIVPYSRTN